jgi:hypothetical protein
VRQAGFVCDDQGNLSIAGGQCTQLILALSSCNRGSTVNPIPTVTSPPTGTGGFPSDPPAETGGFPDVPPFFDGGR